MTCGLAPVAATLGGGDRPYRMINARRTIGIVRGCRRRGAGFGPRPITHAGVCGVWRAVLGSWCLHEAVTAVRRSTSCLECSRYWHMAFFVLEL